MSAPFIIELRTGFKRKGGVPVVFPASIRRAEDPFEAGIPLLALSVNEVGPTEVEILTYGEHQTIKKKFSSLQAYFEFQTAQPVQGLRVPPHVRSHVDGLVKLTYRVPAEMIECWTSEVKISRKKLPK